MSTRANIYVVNGDQKSLYYRHSDGYPSCTGVELARIAKEEDYDYEKVINRLNADSPSYEAVEMEASDAEYAYTIDCAHRAMECYDILDKTLVNEWEFEGYCHGVVDEYPLDWADEGLKAELEAYFKECEEREENYEWKPRFPVNMETPAELTEEQFARGLKIYDAVCKFMDENPESNAAPTLCITQEWEISVDYGGWRCDSDFVDTCLCVMCRDDEGFYINLDYVNQCVPFIEEKLKEYAEWCKEEYGEVPSHREQSFRRVVTLENEIISVLLALIDKGQVSGVNLEIDTFEQTVYPVPAENEMEDYGGIILFVPVETLIKKGPDGVYEVDLDKVSELSSKVNND